jgi:hypothetical protein
MSLMKTTMNQGLSHQLLQQQKSNQVVAVVQGGPETKRDQQFFTAGLFVSGLLFWLTNDT